ncbi:MAG: hypothetical protein Q9184_000169 [Pyrenodesmia sp. 2 TL-2023]
MSTITRTWRNLRRIGLKEYARQMMYIGDTKAGTYIATDRYGNKYYENQDEELPQYDPYAVHPQLFLPPRLLQPPIISKIVG